jgi:hypothetical protein
MIKNENAYTPPSNDFDYNDDGTLTFSESSFADHWNLHQFAMPHWTPAIESLDTVVSAVEVQLDVVDVVTPGIVVVDIARVVHMDALLVAGPFLDSEEVV